MWYIQIVEYYSVQTRNELSRNEKTFSSVQFSSVQLLSCVRLFPTPWIASLSITNSRSSLKLTSIESVMPSSHLILCHPLLLLPSIPPSIRVFSNESTLRMRCHWGTLNVLKKWSSHHSQQKSVKCTIWMQSQKWQNDLCLLPRQTIQ